ncbi:hypothetical protein GCM10022226_48070 [Sphaerisporangium flaviroseum]|uniref:Uncharacterized protein n=1 Tax=Sphaerisporangium flaviroseum TaxID=509199 RepID=A0ABP7IMQ2_9ACTN
MSLPRSGRALHATPVRAAAPESTVSTVWPGRYGRARPGIVPPAGDPPSAARRNPGRLMDPLGPVRRLGAAARIPGGTPYRIPGPVPVTGRSLNRYPRAPHPGPGAGASRVSREIGVSVYIFRT